MEMSETIYLTIAALSMLNFIRIFAMLIGSDFYDLRQLMLQKRRLKIRAYRPKISAIIPAYNEEMGVIRTIESILINDYKNKEIIVVDDGSSDRTLSMLKYFQRKHPGSVKIISQPNSGKAAAINKGLKKAKGSLIMVVDADSILHPTGIRKMVEHFRNRRVIASAANVKIIPNRKMLGLAQRYEYLISYRMKRALTSLNVEYIVGGVGSTFRRSALEKAGGYDTDTMTEDIDLTVKLIRIYGNRYYKINYAADCLAYTEHVLSFKSLVKQRFRWKYGRFQTLLKNKELFFNRSKKYDQKLTWIQLPYALFGEAVLLLEPLLVGYILYVTLAFTDFTSMFSVYLIVSGFVFIMLLGEESEKLRTKLSLALLLPIAYFLMYILAAVEFLALIKSLRQSKKLFSKHIEEGRWEHVERSGGSISI